jgi:hypothetical protein
MLMATTRLRGMHLHDAAEQELEKADKENNATIATYHVAKAQVYAMLSIADALHSLPR